MTQESSSQKRSNFGLSLKANFAWTFAGRFVYAGCQWGMLTALAKLGSPEMVGRFSLGLAITAPIIMFSQLQLRGVQATDARGEYQFGHYLALRLAATVCALVVISLVILVSGYRGETALIILGIGLFKALESISDIHYGFMQYRERLDFIAMALMIKGPLLLFVLGMTLKLTGNLFWAVSAMILPAFAVLAVYERRNVRLMIEDEHGSIRARWQWPRLASLAWLALPLGLVMMLLSLNTNFPRYFIERTLGERELGFFAALAYLLVAGNTIVSAMGQSASPRMARYFAGGNIRKYRALLLRLVGLGALLGLGGVTVAGITGKPLLTLLYRPEYALYNSTFVWLMAAGSLIYMASLLGYGMTAARRFRAQLPLFTLVTAVTAAASFYMIPRFGLNGGAIALSLGAGAQIIGSGLIIAQSIYRKQREQQSVSN